MPDSVSLDGGRLLEGGESLGHLLLGPVIADPDQRLSKLLRQDFDGGLREGGINLISRFALIGDQLDHLDGDLDLIKRFL